MTSWAHVPGKLRDEGGPSVQWLRAAGRAFRHAARCPGSSGQGWGAESTEAASAGSHVAPAWPALEPRPRAVICPPHPRWAGRRREVRDGFPDAVKPAQGTDTSA